MRRRSRATRAPRAVELAAAQGLATLQEKVDPRWPALVVVDHQNDFWHPRGAFAKTGFDPAPLQAIAPALRTLVREARRARVPASRPLRRRRGARARHWMRGEGREL